MNTKLLLGSLLSAVVLLASCDNGIISGPTYADVTARVTPFRGRFDSVGFDVRVGSFRGPIRASYINSPAYEKNRTDYLYWDPDQIQFNIPDLPVGEWTIAAIYYKTNWKITGGDTVKVGTAHRVAVDQAEVSVVYDPDCDCNVVQGDDVDLRLLD
jgi:hypothetical protein